MEAHDLDLGHGLLDDLEVVLAHLHHLVEFGETLVGVEDQSADGLVFATVGQSEVEELVGLVDLQASREDVVAVGGLLRDIVGVVVLVLDVAEDLLDDVLQRDDARGVPPNSSTTTPIDFFCPRKICMSFCAAMVSGTKGIWRIWSCHFSRARKSSRVWM